jgi:hypothetical protein
MSVRQTAVGGRFISIDLNATKRELPEQPNAGLRAANSYAKVRSTISLSSLSPPWGDSSSFAPLISARINGTFQWCPDSTVSQSSAPRCMVSISELPGNSPPATQGTVGFDCHGGTICLEMGDLALDSEQRIPANPRDDPPPGALSLTLRVYDPGIPWRPLAGCHG